MIAQGRQEHRTRRGERRAASERRADGPARQAGGLGGCPARRRAGKAGGKQACGAAGVRADGQGGWEAGNPAGILPNPGPIGPTGAGYFEKMHHDCVLIRLGRVVSQKPKNRVQSTRHFAGSTNPALRSRELERKHARFFRRCHKRKANERGGTAEYNAFASFCGGASGQQGGPAGGAGRRAGAGGRGGRARRAGGRGGRARRAGGRPTERPPRPVADAYAYRKRMSRSTWPSEVVMPGMEPLSEYCQMVRSTSAVGRFTPYSAYHTG